MAAPLAKTLANLNGIWVMSKSLSDPFDPILSLQGVSWFKRKALGFASITINVRQFLIEPPSSSPPPPSPSTSAQTPDITNPLSGNKEMITQIEIEQSISPGGLKNHESRILNWEENENDDDTFGLMKGRSRWIKKGDAEWEGLDAWLKEGWLVEGRDGATPLVGGKEQEWILSTARNERNAWDIDGLWGFQEIGGKRYYCRKLVVRKGDVVLRARLVYDWVKE